ncbi:hypothetical protein [Streptomyces sp. NPDC013187]|uniref:hypothetical protein n=1 Tax=Streptomyces sp. NPDC013187 TaxID=3364865 RepID=UPI0036C4E681
MRGLPHGGSGPHIRVWAGRPPTRPLTEDASAGAWLARSAALLLRCRSIKAAC